MKKKNHQSKAYLWVLHLEIYSRSVADELGIYVALQYSVLDNRQHAAAIDLCWYFKFWVRGTLSGFQAQLLSPPASCPVFRAPLCSQSWSEEGAPGVALILKRVKIAAQILKLNQK